MNPLIIGAWDGSNVWMQWEPAEGAVNYEVRMRMRAANAVEWEQWQPTMLANKIWLIYPTNRQLGTKIEGAVRVQGEEDWAAAKEAKFVRSKCTFEFSSQRNYVYYKEETLFHRPVDGAACSYRLLEEVELQAGESVQREMVAAASSGFAQLDKAGDFLLRPGLGIVIQNIEPSRNDVELTGRDFTEIVVAQRDGPVTLAFIDPEAVQ